MKENKMKQFKSKLILRTFDGTMEELKITPSNKNTKVEFQIRYYNEMDIRIKASIIFEDVIAVDFRINYFDNCVGLDLGGFYEILENNYKVQLIEEIFENRRHGHLLHGDYSYDPTDDNDLLNNRESLSDILKQLDCYHLYQQQAYGGILLVLAKSYCLVEHKNEG